MSDASREKKWVVVDPLLSGGVDGHPQTMVRALLQTGDVQEAWGSVADVQSGMVKVFAKPWRRVGGVLGRGLWAKVRFRLAWLRVVLTSNWQMFCALWPLRKSKQHWVFMNGKNQFVLAMVLLASIRRGQRHVVWFFDPPNRFYRVASWMLCLLRTNNMCFLTETPSMAKTYAAWLMRPCHYAPFPMALRPLHANQEGVLHLAVLGPARMEKGFDLLPKVLACFQEELLAGKLRLQIQSAPAWEPDLAETVAALAQFPGVEMLPSALSVADYQAALDQAHGVLAPYRLANYRNRSSWVAVEAIAAGKVVLMTQGMPACELVKMHGEGLFFEDGSITGVVQCIRHLLADRAIVTRAQDKARVFRENGFWNPSYPQGIA